jgi:integrase
LYAYLTGWRKNGIANLRWEQANEHVIFLPAKYWKNRKPQTIPIAGEIADIVARRRAACAVTTKDGVTLSEFIFHRDGKPIGDIRKAWKTACELAGIPGRLFHDLCRTFARNADRAGVKRSVAMECMGRKTESIYLRYRIVDEGEKADALVQVQEYLRNEPSERDRAVPSRVQ